MAEVNYQTGDLVVYRKLKLSSHPGPRARSIDPAPKGELYRYIVDKFWVVAESRDDKTVVLQTRRGKRHVVKQTDNNLRRANLWERIRYRERFPQIRENSSV